MRGPAPPYRGEGPHALWHVSEDDSVSVFRPRRSTSSPTHEQFVWAVDTRHLPLFWFPRDCPRATFWRDERTTAADVERLLPGGASRVHAIEAAWHDAMRSTRVLAYRLPGETFEPHPGTGGYWLSRSTIRPLELVDLGDLLVRHAESEIELRIVPNLWPLWQQVIASTLEFSGIRLRNAQPPPEDV